MNNLHPLVGKPVELEISGKMLPIQGNLIEFGSDILVIYNGKQFIYIPSIHVQHIKLALKAEFDTADLSEAPLENQSAIEYHKLLTNARGTFLELYMVGNHSIHGYLESIMDDFLVFNSPIYHTVLISLNHIKYFIPYIGESTPYSLKKENLLARPSTITLANTWDQQLKLLEGEFIVLDLGGNLNKVGLLNKFEAHTLELITANGIVVYMQLEHVKTVHLP